MDIITTCHLQQQTPLIHFQHDEPGACLRASEVKPKLDRFLREQLGDKIKQEWRIGKTEALDYKMRFAAKGEPQIEDPHKLYFGNMGVPRAEYRKTVFYREGIEMTILCLPPDLSDIIHELLPYFFALHAFGTRSGKGFGCFALADGKVDPEKLRDCCPVRTYYQIKYPNPPPSAAILNDIWVLSGMMKSGFNFTFRNPTDYYKGRIFRYFSKKDIGGDKAFIKQKVLRGQDRNINSEERTRYGEYRFVRAMLGLPGGFEFRSGPKTTRSGNVKVKPGQLNEADQIGRFQSPVHYCLQGNLLRIIPQDIPKEMLNAPFRLNNQTIRTPAAFDLIDFLDTFYKDFNARIDIATFRSQEIRNTLVSDRRLTIQKLGGDTP